MMSRSVPILPNVEQKSINGKRWSRPVAVAAVVRTQQFAVRNREYEERGIVMAKSIVG